MARIKNIEKADIKINVKTPEDSKNEIKNNVKMLVTLSCKEGVFIKDYKYPIIKFSPMLLDGLIKNKEAIFV